MLGSIVLILFPFSQNIGKGGYPVVFKKRPALIVFDDDQFDVVVLPITASQPFIAPYEIGIRYWKEAGLALPSAIRLHKPQTILKTDIDKILGEIQPHDLTIIKRLLNDMWL